MTKTEHLLCEKDGAVARVILNRPDRLNALSHALLVDLRELLAYLDTDSSTRAVVLSGAGRAFCAGADLAGGPSDTEEVLRTYYNPLVNEMCAMDTPIIAAVNGVAAGAGFSLALACDLRLASESASFRLSFVNVGLVPDAGATWTLPRVVGLTRALEIALLGKPVGAASALAWNLVNEVVKPEHLVERSVELGKELSALPASVGPIRHLIREATAVDLNTQLDHEATTQGAAQHHPHYAEARSAFREKRSPTFYTPHPE